MEYDMMTCPFEYDSFKNLRKKEAEKYFNWYVSQIEYRITALKEAVLQDRRKIALNYSLESLIPLWDWYETKIRLVNKSEDELKKEFDNALCLQASQMCEAELEAFIFGCRFIFRLLGACSGDENNDFLAEELLRTGGEAI